MVTVSPLVMEMVQSKVPAAGVSCLPHFSSLFYVVVPTLHDAMEYVVATDNAYPSLFCR